ncbi:hypothetical protein TWF506_009137 [Arthrobotrys conoides]|uniref:Clr5 domain-containing protein n=1 Tax=Arthrobotrys conoides TaxID=74498 RepID=A0AAN8N895_9PEZI
MENQTPQRKKKRAPRCKELDNPLIRKEIEFRYGIEGRKLDDVVEEINKAHGLSATKIQYRERLNKWGCKQRLNRKEYQRVHEIVTARKALNKESKVFLNSTELIVVPEKRLRRWVARNTTFTNQLFSKARNPTLCLDVQVLPMILDRHEHCRLVRTPSPDPETFLLPIVKKTVAIYYPYTPIGQLHNYFEKNLPKHLWHPDDSRSALSAHQSLPHLPLLGTIIYRISNYIIASNEYKELYSLLDQVDKHGFRTQLKNLFSINSPSILATCSALIDSFYFRRDDEMLEYLRSIDYIPRTPRGRSLDNIIGEISNIGLCPQSAWEARSLLVACKRTSEDLGVFRRLWDPQKVTIQNLQRIGGFELEEQPLYSRNPYQLKWLLECGFNSCKFTILFEAIVLSDWGSMQLFCENLGIKYKAGIFHSLAERKHPWELLDKATFYDIIPKCIAEIETLDFEAELEVAQEIEGPDIKPEIWIRILAYAACVEPHMTQYIVELIQWKYSNISIKDAARMAINALPILRFDELVVPYQFYDIFSTGTSEHAATNRPLVLETLLRFGVDPNETSFWQISLWEEIIVANSLMSPQATLQIFKRFIDLGADVDINFGFKISELLDKNDNFRSSLRAWSSSIVFEYFSSYEMYTPIEIAFGIETSSMFCLLMERSASVHQLYDRLTSRDCCGVHPEFVRAIQERNRAAIEDLWDQRFLNSAIVKAINNGNFDAARSILLTYTCELRLSSLFRDVLRCTRPPELYCDTHFGNFVSLLLEESCKFAARLSTQASNNPEAFSNLTTPDDNWMIGYWFLLRNAIYFTPDSRTLKFLFSLYPTVAKLSNTPLRTLYQLHEHGIFLLNIAARRSPDRLKFLVSQGACIDEAEVRLIGRHEQYLTALEGAIDSGNIETVAYALSQGANVYAPCDMKSSAIEYAISKKRIDSLALILEAVPNSYPLALELAENPDYKDSFIAEFVRTWKPADLRTDV